MSGREKGKAGKRILVVRFSALGDVAMTLPVVWSLARQYPDVHIDFVTSPFFSRIALNPPPNLTVIGIDKKEYRGIAGTVRLLKRLSELKPDCVADLHNVLRTWIIDAFFRLRGVPVEMVDKMRSARREVIRSKTPQPSFFDRYREVFARLGYPVEVNFNGLFESGVPVTPVTVPHPAVGIAPFARYYNKTYPFDLTLRLVKELTDRGVNVLLFGGRGEEAAQLEEAGAGIEGCESVAGRFPIEQELALMAAMDVMVSMDSANHHLASLAGTPVVSVWGSTTPACGFMGYRQDAANAVVLGLSCQPCSIAGKPDCPLGHFHCMNLISPNLISGKVMSIIGKKGTEKTDSGK